MSGIAPECRRSWTSTTTSWRGSARSRSSRRASRSRSRRPRSSPDAGARLAPPGKPTSGASALLPHLRLFLSPSPPRAHHDDYHRAAGGDLGWAAPDGCRHHRLRAGHHAPARAGHPRPCPGRWRSGRHDRAPDNTFAVSYLGSLKSGLYGDTERSPLCAICIRWRLDGRSVSNREGANSSGWGMLFVSREGDLKIPRVNKDWRGRVEHKF